MRRNVLIILGVAVLAWGVLAIVLGSASLKLARRLERVGEASRRACLPATLAHSAALAGTAVDVSPAPETDTANPATQISFRGVPAAQIRDVSVVGSRSGAHSRAPARATRRATARASRPPRPFAAGERVSVRAVIGAGGAGRSSFQFASTRRTRRRTRPTSPTCRRRRPTTRASTRCPRVQAPVMTVTTPDRDPAAGDIFTTNGPGPGQYGPLIYTPQGRLVWFEQLPEGEAAEDLSASRPTKAGAC